jgi:hypothetical protein
MLYYYIAAGLQEEKIDRERVRIIGKMKMKMKKKKKGNH